VVISAWFFSPPLVAQEVNAWQFGSLQGIQASPSRMIQQVHEVWLKCSIAGMPTDINAYHSWEIFSLLSKKSLLS
jgi:hypothetical protein